MEVVVVVVVVVLVVVVVDVELVVVVVVVVGVVVVVVVVVVVGMMFKLVVGMMFKLAIATAVYEGSRFPTPNSPMAFSPQQRTSPVDITAHACVAPATMSTTVPDNPLTAPGV